MRTIKKKRIRIVEAPSGAECQERLNRVLDELCLYEPVIERDTTIPFTFYVYYSISEKIAECKADEYELQGIKLYCSDCPQFVLPDDKRLGCRCGKTHAHTKATDRMCDDGFNELERKENK